MKDPDYIYKYHTGQLEAPRRKEDRRHLREQGHCGSDDADKIAELLR